MVLVLFVALRNQFLCHRRIANLFQKHGFSPNWIEQMYKIHKINKSTPVTYILKDLKDGIIEGGFYKEELQKNITRSVSNRESFEEEKNQWN